MPLRRDYTWGPLEPARVSPSLELNARTIKPGAYPRGISCFCIRLMFKGEGDLNSKHRNRRPTKERVSQLKSGERAGEPAPPERPSGLLCPVCRGISLSGKKARAALAAEDLDNGNERRERVRRSRRRLPGVSYVRSRVYHSDDWYVGSRDSLRDMPRLTDPCRHPWLNHDRPRSPPRDSRRHAGPPDPIQRPNNGDSVELDAFPLAADPAHHGHRISATLRQVRVSGKDDASYAAYLHRPSVRTT